MKDKILIRVILIMTVAVFVTVALIFLLYNMYSIDNSKKFLRQESVAIIDELEQAENEEDIRQRLEYENSKESYYKFVVLRSDKSIILGGEQRVENEDGEIEIIESETIDISRIGKRQFSKAASKGEAFFIAKPYKSGSTINYLVNIENQNFDDGYIIYMCSVDVIYNSRRYYI
ncbi:MAG: hypothetical protein K2K24_02605, partial [Clostridia bacterium]|nr:hypothetical protein [Clostridia bacterium]